MLEFYSDPMPLRLDDADTIRVGQTRVTLNLLIYAFNQGKSPEAIVYSFPTLDRADIYSVIGYYLQHRAEIDAYLEQRQQEAEAFRGQMEALFNPHGLRERLLARRSPAQFCP